MDGLLEHAGLIQTLALVFALIAAALWERWRPLLHFQGDDGPRRVGNYGLLGVNYALGYAIVPAAAVISAWVAQAWGIGLLPQLALPAPLQWLIAILAIDLLGWLLHWSMHHVALLWRFHQVHHNDLEFDSSLGLRFHPLETAYVALATALGVALLGLPPEAVLVSGVLTTVHNFFGHANASLPAPLESWLRRAVITPDLHRVHHSADQAEAMANFGIVFSFWDRLFGSLRSARAFTPDDFGLSTDRDPARLSLPRLLWLPLRRP